MKKVLHIMLLLVATFSFGQAPVVSTPILVTANDNSLSIRATILANGSANFSIIYSEDAFFTPSVTWYANNVTVLPTSTSTNVNYTIPCLNSGDNYYVKVSVTNSVGTTVSNYTTMTTTGSVFNNYPKLNTFSVGNLTTTSASIDLNIDNNANASVTGLLYYGLSETTMNSQLTVPTTNSDNASTSVNLSSLTPNTTYYVRVNLSNGTNCTSSEIRQFTTPMVTTLLYHFPFNGNRDAVVGSGSFSSGGSGTFVSDGLGNASGALEVNSADNFSTQTQSATLSQLPQGNTARSVVMRVRFNDDSATHYLVSWGGSTNGLSYGFEKTQIQGCSSVWGDNKCFPDQTFVNIWATYVITYDGANNTARYYKNGIQINNGQTHGTVNTTGTTIKLGTSLATNFGDANFWIDDLKIYSGVLSQTEITALSSSAAVPTISSVTSTSVGTTQATINYSINAGGAGTTPIVRYGLSSTNLNLSQTGAVVNGSTITAQSVNLTGLTSGTTYFYKVEASNSGGNATPSITLSFTTTTATTAPAITSVAASNVTFNAATINFNLNAFGSATTYVVEYTTDVLGTWQTQSGGTSSVNAATPFQVQLSNLTPNKTYFVRVKATNATGQITTTPEIQFNIPTPIVLTNVNDSNVTATIAQINYTLNTNGYDAVVEIRYQAGTFFDSDNPFTTRVITTAVNNTTATNYNYTLTGLTPNTTYSYQFGAVTQNAGGIETGENAAFTTTAPLGLNDNKQRLNFSMYPNPANNILNIDSENELKSVEIYSLLGQKVLLSTSKTVNVSGLSKGIYMVRVEDKNGAVATQKLVKQ